MPIQSTGNPNMNVRTYGSKDAPHPHPTNREPQIQPLECFWTTTSAMAFLRQHVHELYAVLAMESILLQSTGSW